MNENILWLLIAFQLKHLLCDYFFQYPRHFMVKGTYGKWGGVEHALIHGAGTLLVFGLAGYFLPVFGLAAIIDFVIHYHVDWAKMKLGAVKGWKPDNNKFWWALGVDQFLHHVTYIGLIWYFV